MKNQLNRRGVVDPLTLTVLVLIGLGVAVPASRPWNWFKKGPAAQANAAAEQLQKLEAERAVAQAKADQLQRDKDAAAAAAQAAKDRELAQAQQLTFGAAESLARVTQPSVEVRTASTMLQHALVYQSFALGDLTPTQKAEVIRLVDIAVSGREAEFQAALAKKDAEVRAVQKEKEAALAQTDELRQQLDSAKGAVQTLTDKVVTTTGSVTSLTKKAADAESERDSFSTQLQRVFRWIVYAVIAYVVIVYILPVLSLAFPALKGLGSVSGWLAAPFHQLNVKKKEELAADLVGANEDAKKWIEEKFGAEAREEFKKKVLAEWVTVHDGTAHAVAQLKNSKLLREREKLPSA